MQIKTKIVSCHTADSKPVKQEVNGTVILIPLVFLHDPKFEHRRLSYRYLWFEGSNPAAAIRENINRPD